jgi:voltage-gated potassium channel
MKTVANAQRSVRPYELFMLILCGYALFAMALETVVAVDDDTRRILQWADNAVCGIFLCDFLITFSRAKNRWKYLGTWGWVDLASSVPMVDILRWGRLARILRIFRVLRGVRSTRIIASFLLERRAEGGFLAAALISLLLIVFASIAILQVETDDGANIKGPGDAVWWAFVTLTTVGYGDRFPVTTEGRLIGAMLMTAGVGLFGVLSGFVAAWFLSPNRKEQEVRIEDLHREIKQLVKTLEETRREPV